MTTVAVLGAGSWGTTLAHLLAGAGHAVRLWAYEPEVVEGINREHVNGVFLPGCPLDASLAAVGDPGEAVRGAEAIVSVTPSHAARTVLGRLGTAVSSGTPVIVATKGIEPESLKLMHQVAAEALPQTTVTVLSGPSFAAEVYQGQPTAVVAASENQAAARAAQQLFSTPRFRVYTNADVVGVELGGSLKNVIAIAAGVLQGLGMGNNPRAALLTRGLAEVTRLGVALGADPLTFAGLAGVGDLILTATGPLSRNRALGIALAEGENLEAYGTKHRTVAEGVNTAKAAVALADRVGVELPITTQVTQILFEGKAPATSVAELMERDLKSERWQ